MEQQSTFIWRPKSAQTYSPTQSALKDRATVFVIAGTVTAATPLVGLTVVRVIQSTKFVEP
jgi:hypothetical protein